VAEHGTPSEVAYARSGDVHLAYQTLGSGDRDIVQRIGGFIPISLAWSYPPLAGFLRRLAGMGRLVLFDRRGVGLSDPVAMGAAGTTEQLAEDLMAVLDACGSESAVLSAGGFDTAPSVCAAAIHPDRIQRLVMLNPVVRTRWAPDFPFAPTAEQAEAVLEQVLGGEDLRAEPGDDGRADFLERAGRQGASPGSARAIYASYADLDIRDLLPQVTQPTLVLSRPDAALLGHSQAEFLADHVADSKLSTVPGSDFFAFIGETETLLSEMEQFITGVAGASAPDRVLRVMLFSDIVGSTELAVDVGDEAWRRLLDRHDQIIEEALGRFGGAKVNPTGDGILATFPTPSAALGCAVAMADALRGIGLSVRFGVHVGEVEMRGGDIGGLGVNLAARVMGEAGPDEIVVSDAVPSLVRGSGLSFESLGARQLRGVPFEVEVHRLERSD
jgi:class 3 adenylate cyclase/pimeloyl-ACP methyl ester carboxylesterase